METGQLLIADDSNSATWTTVGKTLLSINQTDLSSSFTQANNTNEQEVAGIRVTLPIIEKICTLKVTFAGWGEFQTGNNNLRIRIGTNGTYLSNTEYQNLYIDGALQVPTMVGTVILELDLSTQTYVVISMQNDAGNGGILSAALARTSVITEIYS